MRFQDEVRCIVGKYNYYIGDIDYINLSNQYTTTSRTFFELKEEPACLRGDFKRVSWCDTWDLPEGFKIVMNNGSFFVFVKTDDEYYSRWVYMEPPRPSPIPISISNNNETP